MSETSINYARAFEELQAIVTEIELGQISVDILSEKVKRASELIAICKSKLSSTEDASRSDLPLDLSKDLATAPFAEP